MTGPARDVRRGLVFYRNFSPGQKLDIEQCALLSNQMVAAAQNWANGKRRLTFFEIAITDFHQPLAQLCRPLGPLLPQHGAGGGEGGHGGGGGGPGGGMGGGGDEEDPEDLKALTNRYLGKMSRITLTAMREVHAMMGQFMQLQQASLLSQGSHVERLQNANMQLHDQTQTAQDRSTERAIWVKREEMKIKAIGSGLKVGENLLYGWFGVQPEPVAAPTDGDKSGAGAAPAPRFPPSPEQRLVGSFLEEVADEKLSVQLFGDWKDTDRLTLQDVLTGLGLETPGIFQPQQFGLFLGVRDGLLPPTALDAILPDSGKPQAITMEQMLAAQPLLTQGMLMALNQIRELRLAARASRLAASGAAPSQGETP